MSLSASNSMWQKILSLLKTLTSTEGVCFSDIARGVVGQLMYEDGNA